MNFLKKVLGFGPDLKAQIQKFEAQGTFFQVVKGTRNVKLKVCHIKFTNQDDIKYFLSFQGKDESKQIYELPIHLNMNPVNFVINKSGKAFTCFEWQIEDENDHVGCYMAPQAKNQFKDILCKILKLLAKDDNIKDHLSFCKELSGIPVYKSAKQSNISVSSGISSQQKELLNNVLISQAQKQENKMVHTCSYYVVQMRERKLVQENLVFVLKSYPNFKFQFHLVNQTGFTILKKQIDSGLNYEINVEKGYIRWINTDEDCIIIEVNLDGKRDAALSLKYNMLECFYELRQKKNIHKEIPEDQIQFMKKMTQEKPDYKQLKDIVKVYEQNSNQIQQILQKSYIYEDQQAKNGKIKYKTLCQAKIDNFSIAALGSLLETLTISEDSKIKLSNKKNLLDKKQEKVEIAEIYLHDNDTKGFIRGQNGKLYYEDLIKGKLIEQFNPSPKKGIVAICPQIKMSNPTNFKTFKAISENAIYQIDPRTKQGVGSLKDYTSPPNFNTLAVTQNGSFAVGSNSGQIRFYKQIGKNANNKFTAGGDPVLHLDTTKDGKWVLATFSRYLRLIPTENQNQSSLFTKKISFAQRPTPLKLEISLQDIQRLNIKDFCFISAKFDQSHDSIERFIISGFGNYTVIWNLGQAIKGDRSYILSKNEGKIIQADFKYNDPKRLIMTTNSGIILKQNKIKKDK